MLRGNALQAATTVTRPQSAGGFDPRNICCFEVTGGLPQKDFPPTLLGFKHPLYAELCPSRSHTPSPREFSLPRFLQWPKKFLAYTGGDLVGLVSRGHYPRRPWHHTS